MNSPRHLPARELFALGTLLSLAHSVAAPSVSPPAQTEPPTSDEKPQALADLVVEAVRGSLYKPENLQTPKLSVPIRDVPQSVTVIPNGVIKEQNTTSLRDILKNVPGISMQAGEGGVPNGDNLSIRGFNARTDLFVDGVRDFGGYSRDPFNLEQVEVTKGPSSSNGGRGSTGGAVNLGSKTPSLRNDHELMLGRGSDSYGRTTFDTNHAIPGIDGAALRINAMLHTQDVPGRKDVSQERWGVAPSIAFGLETDTRFILSYFHLSQDNVPDNGIPFVPRTGNNTGLPSGIPNVDFDNFYGLLSRDYEKVETDMLTGILEHDFNDNLKLRNTTRYGLTDRDSITTSPRFDNSGPDAADVRRTDWKSRDQVDTILASQTNLRMDFETGPIRHELVSGLEWSRETSRNYGRRDLNGGGPNTDLEFPNPRQPYLPGIVRDGAVTDTVADSIALYAFDTLKLGEHWQLSGGLRWDSFDVNYVSRTSAGSVTPLQRQDEMLSYRAAITYKPVETGSLYLAYGTSFNPSAEGLSLGNTATATNNLNTDPEENLTLELGTKWDLFDAKLSLTAALFRTDKTNARTEDPTDPSDVVALTGEQSVQGFEIGLSGEINESWHLLGGYTWLDSEIRESKNALEVGNELMNTPEHSFNLWSVHALPAGFEFGFGVQFTDDRFNNNNRSTRQTAPDFLLFDAMLSYRLNDHISLRLNGYNLGDKDYADQLGGGHFVPGTGRSFVLSTNITF